MPADSLVHEPVGVFLTIMAVILITPLLSERLRLPGIVGLIIGGMLVGPHVLNLIAVETPVELLATVGLIYLMFSAGLEIDLNQFNRVRNKSMVFGVFTFLIPQLSGLVVGRLLGLSWAGAVLLGSVYASHTLVAFPILSRLGLARNEAVSVTIGATVFTDVAALLVLAVIAGGATGEVSLFFFIKLFTLMIAYVALVLLGLPRLGKAFFSRFTSQSVEFQFVLVALFLSALLAELIGMHAIVGAFMAGLAINSALPARSRVVGQVLFVGESFFIPLFLMYIGMVIDPTAFVVDSRTLITGVVLTGAVYLTKYLAAFISAKIYHYTRDERMTMWGLSQAQAAATLATILVGTEIGIFPQSVFNGSILMILLTCVTSPLLVERFGKKLSTPMAPAEKKPLFTRILVPIANPETQEYLISLASILVRTVEGVLMPLNVALESSGQVRGLQQQQELLAAEILKDPETEVQPVRRIDTSIARGIVRASLEHDATVIFMGWRGKPTFKQSIFGTVLDEVIWNAEVPVLVGRLNTPINALRRVVLVVPPHSMNRTLADKTVLMVYAIASAINVPLVIFTDRDYVDEFESEIAELDVDYPIGIQPVATDIIRHVTLECGDHDLLVVTTMGSQTRFRSSLGQITEQLAERTSGSMIIVHY